MKVEIEKKVKIELDIEEVHKLLRLLEYVENSYIGNGTIGSFAKQLKQELER